MSSLVNCKFTTFSMPDWTGQPRKTNKLTVELSENKLNFKANFDLDAQGGAKQITALVIETVSKLGCSVLTGNYSIHNIGETNPFLEKINGEFKRVVVEDGKLQLFVDGGTRSDFEWILTRDESN